MKNDLITKIANSTSGIMLKIKNHSPEILIVAGIVGAVASAVMACRGTLKVPEIVEDTKKESEKIHYAYEHPEKVKDGFTEKDKNDNLIHLYFKTGVKFVKVYAPSVIIGALSITAMVSSNRILRQRSAAAAAAYAAVSKSFKEYRSRVVDRFGSDVDLELKHGFTTKEVVETVTDENGDEKTVTKKIRVMDSNQPSEFARFFDESCGGWEPSAEINMAFLKRQEAYANDLLRLRKSHVVFLNEVYDLLGIPRSKAGQTVGWHYVPDGDNPNGDNFISFGIFDVERPGFGERKDFIKGNERSILLDFNVDGNILEYMDDVDEINLERGQTCSLNHKSDISYEEI